MYGHEVFVRQDDGTPRLGEIRMTSQEFLRNQTFERIHIKRL